MRSYDPYALYLNIIQSVVNAYLKVCKCSTRIRTRQVTKITQGLTLTLMLLVANLANTE